MKVAYVWLAGAIGLEVMATSALKSSNGFSVLLPTIVVVIGYVGAFYCLSLALRGIPMGIAYAIWSGIGIVVISAIGWVAYRQSLDWAAGLGITLILAGVLVINLFSKSAAS